MTATAWLAIAGTLAAVLAVSAVAGSRVVRRRLELQSRQALRIEAPREARPAPATTTASALVPVDPTAATQGTIVLVDDDDGIRMLVADVLREHGFTVLTASRGDEAISVVAAHHARIDLLLTDVVMPGINGHELAVVLRRRDPTLRVLFTSGYGADAASLGELATHGARLLQKPYAMRTLVNEVQEALRSPSRAARA